MSILCYFSLVLTVVQGSKIRSTYIAFAQKEKNRLESEVESLEREVVQRQAEVARLKGTRIIHTMWSDFLTHIPAVQISLNVQSL